MAPTKDESLAVSAFSSSASFFNTRTGFKETYSIKYNFK